MSAAPAVILTTADELRALVREAVRAELGVRDLAATSSPTPLADKRGACAALASTRSPSSGVTAMDARSKPSGSRW